MKSLSACLVARLCEDPDERVALELSAPALVELVLEFYPVQPESVQECLHQVHKHQHADREGDEDEVTDQELNKVMKVNDLLL